MKCMEDIKKDTIHRMKKLPNEGIFIMKSKFIAVYFNIYHIWCHYNKNPVIIII